MGYDIKKTVILMILHYIPYLKTSESHTYPITEDLLHGLRIIKYHKSKVGQLSAAVDSQLKDSAVLCAKEIRR